jgi:probable HAF family extracellular repeat protein
MTAAMSARITRPGLAALLLPLIAATARAPAGPIIIPPRYALTNLHERRAADINDAGQVVGSVDPIDENGNPGPTRGFVDDAPGSGPDAGRVRVPGPPPAPGGDSRPPPSHPAAVEATAINASGTVVGKAKSPDPAAPGARAFVSYGDTLTDVGTLSSPTYGRSAAAAINASGTVVGTSMAAEPRQDNGDSVHDSHAFLDRDGRMHDLGNLGGRNSQAVDVNDRGQVAGNSEIGGDSGPDPPPQRAFLSDGVAGHPLADLGTLGGVFSQATALNNLGQVVGSSTTADDGTGSSRTHAFLYSDGMMRDLGVLGGTDSGESSVAHDINDQGQIVGSSTVDVPPGSPATPVPGYGGGNTRATLYDQGILHDLNDLTDLPAGWLLTEALGIDNFGQIVAKAVIPDGIHPDGNAPRYRGVSVLLTPEGMPAPVAPSPVPEPTALAVLVLAIAGRGARWLRRRRSARPARGGRP